MRTNTWQQRVTIGLGIFLSIIMVASLALPLLTQNVAAPPPQAQATNTPRPTAPPVPETSNIGFSRVYLEPSGLFTSAIPTGFELTGETNNSGEVQVTMENSSSLSVVEMRVIRPTDQVSLDSPQSIGAQFTQQWLNQSWTGYRPWSEDQRVVQDDQLVMDFSLESGGQQYVARQVAFTDGTWIYAIRVVTPRNAAEVMQYILENQVASFDVIERYVGAPLQWEGYFDDTSNHLIRLPDGWTVVDAAEGAPASASGLGGQVRVQVTDTVIDSEQAATNYVTGLRSSINVLSVEAVEQFGTSGFRVAYTIPTVDGPTQSGAVLLLTGPEQTHVANVLLTSVADTDLNTVDLAAADVNPLIVNAREMLDSFSLFPELDVADDI